MTMSRAKDLSLMAYTALSLDENFIKCPMCRERYSRPKLLKCLHSFCEHCISVHIGHSARNKEVTHREFPCPKCRALTSVVKPELPIDKWAETLPDNTMMEAMLESVAIQVGCFPFSYICHLFKSGLKPCAESEYSNRHIISLILKVGKRVVKLRG